MRRLSTVVLLAASFAPFNWFNCDLSQFNPFLGKLKPFGVSGTSAQTVFTLTAASNITTADIDVPTTVASVTLPAGTYSVDFNCSLTNNSGTANAGAQVALVGTSQPLTVTTNASFTTAPISFLGDMLGVPSTDFPGDDVTAFSFYSMAFDTATGHGTHTEHVTTAVFSNPVQQTVSLWVSTNAGSPPITFNSGSRITLTKQ